MKKAILFGVLLTLVAFVSGAIAAAPPKTEMKPAPPAKLEKFSGEIKSVNAVAKSIVVAKKRVEKIFVVDETTKITKGKTDLTFADLKAGMSIVTEYKTDGDKLIAVTIKVSAPKAPPKK